MVFQMKSSKPQARILKLNKLGLFLGTGTGLHGEPIFDVETPLALIKDSGDTMPIDTLIEKAMIHHLSASGSARCCVLATARAAERRGLVCYD